VSLRIDAVGPHRRFADSTKYELVEKEDFDSSCFFTHVLRVFFIYTSNEKEKKHTEPKEVHSYCETSATPFSFLA
jgi:hypothetical protein